MSRAALAATLPFVREEARPWIDAKVARAAEDPLLIQQVGETTVQLRAAIEAALARSPECRRTVADDSLVREGARGAMSSRSLRRRSGAPPR